MSIEYVCDGAGCGKRQSASSISQFGCARGPVGWSARPVLSKAGNVVGQQHACSPECAANPRPGAGLQEVPAGTSHNR